MKNKPSGIFVYLIKSQVFPGILGIFKVFGHESKDLHPSALEGVARGQSWGPRGGGVFFIIFRCASIYWFQVVSQSVIDIFQISSKSSNTIDVSGAINAVIPVIPVIQVIK